jgi:hypothetical protein
LTDPDVSDAQAKRDASDATSIISDTDDLVETVTEISGESLSYAAMYEENTVEFLFSRDDFDSHYGRSKLDALADDLGLSAVMGDRATESLHSVGDLCYEIQGFDDLITVRLPLNDEYGLWLGFDPEMTAEIFNVVNAISNQVDVTFSSEISE